MVEAVPIKNLRRKAFLRALTVPCLLELYKDPAKISLTLKVTTKI